MNLGKNSRPFESVGVCVKGVDMQYSCRFKMGQDDTAEQNHCLCFCIYPQETFILSPEKVKAGL